MPSKREWALIVIAPVVIFAAVSANQGDGDSAAPVADEGTRTSKVKAKAEVSRVADAGDLDLSQRTRDATAGDTANAFESKSWYVPPPPPPPPPVAKILPPPPPPAPTAPPLPFTYLGRYDDSSNAVIYLVRGDRVLLVHAGDIIEGTYRVEGIVGTTLGLTYLPLKIRQSLDIGHAG
jgi:hypothetical protein